MKPRASYREAVRWIAENVDRNDTSLLAAFVAAIFGADFLRVIDDVRKAREAVKR